MGSTIRQEIRIRTGTVNGKPDYLIAGFITEENFGRGNVRKRPWLHTSLLNPVLFAQVRPFLNGASYICLEPIDLPRGKPGPSCPPESPAEAPDPEIQKEPSKPTYVHPIHGFHVPEYGQLVATDTGDGWNLSMVHKGSGDSIYETLEWPESWPGEVNRQFLFEEGFKVN